MIHRWGGECARNIVVVTSGVAKCKIDKKNR
jgi:hypothetical protein